MFLVLGGASAAPRNLGPLTHAAGAGMIAGGRCGRRLVIAGGTRWALGPWLRQSLAN